MNKFIRLGVIQGLCVCFFFSGCGTKVQEVIIQPDYNALIWKQKEFTVKSGTQVKLVMDNLASGLDAVMSHNVVVLAKRDTEESRMELIKEVGKAANQAGAEKEFFPENHSGILFRTPMAAPGKRTEVVFTAPEPGDYPYICTFSGHWTTMQGVMHVVK